MTDLENALRAATSDDQLYWDFYVLMKGWAESEWATPLDPSSVDHGIGHSKRILDILSRVLAPFDDQTLVSLLSERYICMLLVAIYTHDIGMQKYYEVCYPELARKSPYELDEYDFRLIRNIHANTIDKVFTTLTCSPKTVPS